jgi:SAM-dependent methyltransferase
MAAGFPKRRGSYGVDAPGVLVAFALAFGVTVAVAIVWHQVSAVLWAAFSFVFLACYLHTTLRGKFRVWSELLDALTLRGDERVLDLGCGRGAILMLAAERLTTGRAVGVDIWRTKDQSGNTQNATEANARAEGVAARVELHTADMTALPFDSASFDVVLSNVAIHNLPTDAARDRAIDEALRVLKPGGRLRITDIQSARRYRDRLNTHGAAEVTIRSVGWRMWWGGPWMSTSLVAGRKNPSSVA